MVLFLRNNNGESSLLIASYRGQVDVVKMLLEKKAQADLQQNNGWSSLMLASQKCHITVVKILLENSAQIGDQWVFLFNAGKLKWPHRCG